MDEVSVPVHILEQIKQTLTSAFYQNQAQDLIDSYRDLRDQAKWSNMTTELSRRIELIQSFIDSVKEDEEVEDETTESGDTDGE